MSGLTTVTGIVAVTAAALGLAAVVTSVLLAFKLRALRRGQKLVLGDGERDIVSHSVELNHAVTELKEFIEEIGDRSQQTIDKLNTRLDSSYCYCALVRYDAYNEMSGMQSCSLALLDSNRNGVVLSSIVHRDSARIYLKEMVRGEPELELSPEEVGAVDKALGASRLSEKASA